MNTSSVPNPSPATLSVDEVPAPQFAIAVSATLQQRGTRTLKHGDTFAVFDHRGDIGGEPGNSEGIYHRDTRMLSQLQLLLEEARPLLLSSVTQDDNAVFTADLSNPDFLENGEIGLRRENVHLSRMKFIWNGACYERLVVRNFSDRPLMLRLTYRFASDFADLFEVRGERRAARGEIRAALKSDHGVTLAYMGLDKIERVTEIRFHPAPKTLTTARAAFDVALKPRATRRIFVRCGLDESSDSDWSGRVFYQRMRAARHALSESSKRAASIESSNSVYNEIVRRSVSDLYMLVTDTPVGPYPYAGIPWFSTPFGRDGLVTALMTLWLDPEIAKGVLVFLAATQATASEPERDAEPGKILHEMRHGEMANLREVPFGRYYGSIDATPLFVLLLGEYFRRTGDLATVRTLWPHAEAALAWIDHYGDRDGDGFVEYHRQTKEGLANQGWKDSFDAIFHHDGRLAEGPIALCEVQGYVYGAKRHAAVLADALGHTARACALAAQADALRQLFEARFWCEELSTYALALDGTKTPCRVVASNAGQLLFTGIASAERAQRVARTLISPASFSGWGIRTVSSSEARYNPMSYHNGSVWPHDNGLIAMGLARYGLQGAAAQVFSALFDAASYMDLRRLPELYCGFRRLERNAPTQYPVACSPQAWASATPLCLLQASLGLELLERTGEVKFYRPMLPAFLDQVHLRNLRLCGGSADVLLHRQDENIAVTVTRREGDIVVVARY
ncbi:MAG TPA: amylo-alpha-1,6-glucosidase [Steroidobacteraceae bacterium]|nr:amylo-alpha-1,6-glucosidase [Steroidobacteraceae bacterium]